MSPLPLLNRFVFEQLDVALDPCVAGYRLADSTSGVVVGSVQVDDLLALVQQHPALLDVDDIDVLSALSGLEAHDLITINDPDHVARYLELVQLADPAFNDRRIVVAIHGHPGR